MNPSLETVDFLSSSPSRFEVLDAIRLEPRTRDDLRELTDVSRVTLSRTLADLEEREWIVRRNGQYDPTAEGAAVAAEVARLLSNLRAVEELGETLEWLPRDQLDFDIECLRDAEIIRQGPRDHIAPMRRAHRRFREADRVRSIGAGMAYEIMEAFHEATVGGDGSLECVVDEVGFDVIRNDPELERLLREMLDTDRVRFFEHGGDETPVMLSVIDEVVLFCGHYGDRTAPEALETPNRTVRAWAESYFESVRADARPLGLEAFTA